jgi:hypothetical protein
VDVLFEFYFYIFLFLLLSLSCVFLAVLYVWSSTDELQDFTFNITKRVSINKFKCLNSIQLNGFWFFILSKYLQDSLKILCLFIFVIFLKILSLKTLSVLYFFSLFIDLGIYIECIIVLKYYIKLEQNVVWIVNSTKNKTKHIYTHTYSTF